MGVDNEAVLIYGWTFDYEEFLSLTKKILEKSGLNFDEMEDDIYALVEIFNEWLSDHYPEFEVESTSPYYDSNWRDKIFYLSYINIENTETLYQKLKENEEQEKYKACNLLVELNIKDKPSVMALPSIW